MIITKRSTAADPIQWDLLQSVITQLIEKKRYRDALMLAIPAYTGLRFSDYSGLKWGDLKGKEILVKEKKTGKVREITLSEGLKNIVSLCQQENNKKSDFIFANNSGKVFSIQYANQHLKRINIEFKMNIKNMQTHCLRKSFAATLWDRYDRSEEGLIIISKILNHSNISITKKYIGITDNMVRAAYNSL